jgi:hypothetical protein
MKQIKLRVAVDFVYCYLFHIQFSWYHCCGVVVTGNYSETCKYRSCC